MSELLVVLNSYCCRSSKQNLVEISAVLVDENEHVDGIFHSHQLGCLIESRWQFMNKGSWTRPACLSLLAVSQEWSPAHTRCVAQPSRFQVSATVQ